MLILGDSTEIPANYRGKRIPREVTRIIMGERQSIAQKSVRAIDTRNSQLENGSNAVKASVRAPGLSTDEREHPLV